MLWRGECLQALDVRAGPAQCLQLDLVSRAFLCPPCVLPDASFAGASLRVQRGKSAPTHSELRNISKPPQGQSVKCACEALIRSLAVNGERFAATLIKGSSFGVKSQLQKAAGEEAGEGKLAPGAGQ